MITGCRYDKKRSPKEIRLKSNAKEQIVDDVSLSGKILNGGVSSCSYLGWLQQKKKTK